MPEIVNKKSVLDMAMGAIAEITDYEVNRVVANIMDPNTAATAKRNIAAYLGEQLADLVESGNVVVLV